LAAYDGLNLDANGDSSKLVKDEAYGGGELTAGHWYTDGTSVWARASDSRTLVDDENFFVYLQTGNAITGESTVYMENITLEGDQFFSIHEDDSGAKVPTVYAKDCTFAYATNYNGVQVEGGHTFFQGCVAKCSNQDGFNYHAKDGVFCHSVEIDCEGRNCGASGSHINNASSTHDGCSIVRLRTIGHDTDGYCIADVDQGVEGEITYSWNVGCIAYGTIEHYAAYYSGNSAPGGMWLIGCESRETNYNDVQLTSDGIIYHYGCIGFYDVNVTEGSSYTELPPNATLITLPATYDAAKTAAQASTALSNVTWTDAKAGYLTGAVALEATLTAIKGAGWSTETLKELYSLLVSGTGLGDGDVEWSHTVTLDGETVEGATIAYYEDAAYTDVAVRGITNSVGVVTFMLTLSADRITEENPTGAYFSKTFIPGEPVIEETILVTA
jgi:hypothetical protein